MRRTLLIAGMTSPIAEALISVVTPAEWRLLGLYHSRTDRAAELMREARAIGLEANASPCDLRDGREVERIAERVLSGPEAVDCVFAAAPRIHLQGVARATVADFEDQYRTQILGALHLLRVLIPRWNRSHGGHVVFVLSSVTLGERATGLGAYVTAKFGLLGLAQTLAQEQRRNGLSVAAVSPRAFPSGIWGEVPEAARPGAQGSDTSVAPLSIAHAIVRLLDRRQGADGSGAPFVNVPVGTIEADDTSA
jgi:3-oxoacyl-[acyl-carrier protein] reductase